MRQFVVFAAISLVPVLVLGLVLAGSYRSEAARRGLAQGRSEALLMAQTAVEPIFDGRPLSDGLNPTETARLHQLASGAVARGDVQRLRIRDLQGAVVFSDDGSGFHQRPEDEAFDAAKGITIARLTRINSDSVDTGKAGAQTVELYLPLYAGPANARVGVLEVYLPYSPISADVSIGIHDLYRNLAIGLGILYVVLFGISFWVVRRLRRQVQLNAYVAEHDALTDLPNRSLFLRRAEAEVARGVELGYPTTIAIVDLDQFKEVNDTLGHHNGDRLLTAIGHRLLAHLRAPDSVARLGGDEFGLVLSNVSRPDDVLARLREVIQQEVQISGLPLSIESSIGYVVASEDGTEIGDLLQKADVAMYVAKQDRSGVVRYLASQNHYDSGNLALVSDLRHAIAADQLVLHYQPKVDLVASRICGVEALVRWQHPTQGLLFPDRFIPLVEQTDLIDELTEWVVGRAVRDLARFSGGSPELTMAVNVSARNLGRSGFARQVLDAVAAGGIAAHRVTVEVTETALMTDPVRAAAVLGEMSDAGVRISVDDFGSGQTSLVMLADLPIAELKIDRGFVYDIERNPAHAAIVRSIVELGHNLGFTVVAEGVETAGVQDVVAGTGCDLVQGYYFARPMPADQLVDRLVAGDPTPV
ncbi:MAG TPA: bifunctional diguanylate cyclase/phosphodiesterase [Acidimicrobiales bacterium]